MIRHLIDKTFFRQKNKYIWPLHILFYSRTSTENNSIKCQPWKNGGDKFQMTCPWKNVFAFDTENIQNPLTLLPFTYVLDYDTVRIWEDTWPGSRKSRTDRILRTQTGIGLESGHCVCSKCSKWPTDGAQARHLHTPTTQVIQKALYKLTRIR